MTRFLFDVEADHLYFDATTIHCLCLLDLDTEEVFTFNDQGHADPIVRGITMLEEADVIVGHNVINYDIPLIKKFYPFFTPKDNGIFDTLVLSHLRFPDLIVRDHERQSRLPPQLLGSHSLKAWGYRLGTHKGSFGGQVEDWIHWSQAMEDYCVQDLKVTYELWKCFTKTYPGLGLNTESLRS